MSECNTRILVALSGGMDSAAAVLLLREAGYEPYALFLDLLDDEAERRKAIETAERLSVPLHIEAAAGLFRREIIGYLLEEHGAGRTPAPCSRCNPRIKWRLLARRADAMGIPYIATGHYVRTVRHSDASGAERFYFARGADPAKDQSYYLWDVPQEYIRRAVLPLGDYTKAEVRLMLRDRYGYEEILSRRESMGVCFLRGSSYRNYLQTHLPPEVLRPGEIKNEAGEVLGLHDGYPLYTIGQKRGLFPAGPSELPVVGVDPAQNTVRIGSADSLYSDTLLIKEWRLTDPDEAFVRSSEVRTVIRGVGRNPQGGCRMELIDGNILKVILLEDRAWAAAPGQPVAFYLDDRVIGGGYIL